MSDYEIIDSSRKESMTVVVGAASRYFAGHFPGLPILPAIAQLALVEVLLRRQLAGDAAIVSVDQLRLLHPVRPGEAVTIHCDPVAAGSCRFRIERGADRISEGVIGWTAGGWTAGEWTARGVDRGGVDRGGMDRGGDGWGVDRAGRSMNAPDPTRLLPHADAARFLAGVVERRADGVACVVRIPATAPYVREERFAAYVLIEAAAQTAAAFLVAELESPSAIGYLVRARTIALSRPAVAIDTRLVAAVRRTGASHPLHLFAVEVRDEELTILKGEIGVYVESGSTTRG